MVFLLLSLFASRTTEAIRIEVPPVIDGMLDEECWQNPGISDFEEDYPDRGDEPSESTRVVVCFDNRFIYFGCFSFGEPDSVTARLIPREHWDEGDNVTISLDTYNDDRNAYRFSVNPLAIQGDVHITGGGSDYDYAWNGLWYAEAGITDWGWGAEIAIPFKTLRFRPSQDQVWGMQISRWIDYKDEQFVWADYEKDDRGTRIDRFGELAGISGIRSGLHMEFLPHLTQTVRFENSTNPRGLDTVTFLPLGNGVVGVDFKWVMRSNLTLDITGFPDYGQIEADPEHINLSKYEHYLSEHRPFFTEGSDLFDIPHFEPVYTRRIGRRLPDGTEVPIYGGAKFTGKLGRTQVGVIEAITGETDYYEGAYFEPAALYSVARVKQDILTRSEAGLIFTSRELLDLTIGPLSEHQGDRAAGVDFRLRLPEDISVSTAGLYSFHSDTGKGGPMGAISIGRSGRFSYSAYASYTDSLADLNHAGYLSRPGHVWGGMNAGFGDSWGSGRLRSLSLSAGPSAGKELADTLWSYSVWASCLASFTNHWYTSLSPYLSRSYYQEDSSLHWVKSISGGFGTSTNEDIYGGLWFSIDDRYIFEDYVPRYFGHVASASPNLTWRVRHNLSVSGYGTFLLTFLESWEFDEAHPFRWTAGQSLRYTATRRLSFRFNAQQNTDAERYSQQLLATWEIAPLSCLYLASSMNLAGDDETPNPFDVQANEFTLYGKIAYLFQK